MLVKNLATFRINFNLGPSWGCEEIYKDISYLNPTVTLNPLDWSAGAGAGAGAGGRGPGAVTRPPNTICISFHFHNLQYSLDICDINFIRRFIPLEHYKVRILQDI